jgi:hypothetical protein
MGKQLGHQFMHLELPCFCFGYSAKEKHLCEVFAASLGSRKTDDEIAFITPIHGNF